jgi:MoaA/NifB/PqqE/SkfB family radical SAM enzyme
MLKVIPRIFFHRGDPLQLIFFITARCNLGCRHCFYAESLNKSTNELSIEEINKISKGMGNLLWIALTGGEPFLRKDIAQIAETFYRNNKFKILTITTNGMFQDSITKAVSEICRRCKKSHIIVYVSLDGLEETHNKIRETPGGFQKVLGTIQKLKILKKDFKNLSVATVTTINEENQEEVKDLAMFLKDSVKPDNIAMNIIRGKPKSIPLGNIDLKNYFDFIKVQREGWSGENLAYFDFFGKNIIKKKELLQKEIIATVFKENRYVLPCLAGNISCVITETGDLYPCEILNRKIGNLREAGYDFRKLHYSKNAEGIRQFIKDTKCYCTFECAITTNILFNIKQLIKMLLK